MAIAQGKWSWYRCARLGCAWDGSTSYAKDRDQVNESVVSRSVVGQAPPLRRPRGLSTPDLELAGTSVRQGLRSVSPLRTRRSAPSRLLAPPAALGSGALRSDI